MLIGCLLLCPQADAQRTIAPNDPVYFRKAYVLPKEQFYLLSVKRATAHYYQFYNDVAKQKQAKEITMVEIYPDSLVTDTNLLINQVHVEKYRKGFLTEAFIIKYLRSGENHSAAGLSYDTLDWKQYSYTNRNRSISVLNKRYGRADNYTDSLRTFYFSRKKRLLRTISRNDGVRQTDTRFSYTGRGALVQVTSVFVYSQTQIPLEEKRWQLRYTKHRTGTALPQQLLDSAATIPALAFVGQELSGPPAGSMKIIVDRFERSGQEQTMRHTGTDSVLINRKGDYQFVLSVDQADTSVRIRKIKGKLAVHRAYLELGIGDDRRRAFHYTSRQLTDGSIVYENNFRGKIVSGSCSQDIEKTVITDTEDGTAAFYRIRR
ncbi:MAG TPA: hypothetical protein VL092_07600 [Chitinophagaceae bacterium]|nr:hypothetical protein [Chitinophagaceae bacterium]